MTKGDVSSADAGADETANYDMGQHRGDPYVSGSGEASGSEQIRRLT